MIERVGDFLDLLDGGNAPPRRCESICLDTLDKSRLLVGNFDRIYSYSVKFFRIEL